MVSEEDLAPGSIGTTANVYPERDDKGPVITTIELNSTARCPGLSKEKFNGLTKLPGKTVLYPAFMLLHGLN